MLTAIFSLPLSVNSMVNEYQEDSCADYEEDYDDNDDATGKQYSSKAELELRRDIFHANLVK